MTLHRAIVQGLDESDTPIGVTTAVDFRQGLSVVAQRDGVFYEAADSAACTGSPSTMDVTISPFHAAYTPSVGGRYLITEDGTGGTNTVTLDPGDSSNDRVDVIYVWQKDVQVDTDERTSPVEYGVAQGTPASDPVAPEIPNGAFALWEALVPANATTADEVVFSAAFDWTAPVGVPLPVPTLADLPAASVPGRRASVLAVPGLLVVDTGSAWRSTPTPGVLADKAAIDGIGSPITGILATASDTGITYRYDGTGWRGWDSPWVTLTVTSGTTYTGWNVGSTGTATGRKRYTRGKVIYEFVFTLGGTGISVGALAINLDESMGTRPAWSNVGRGTAFAGSGIYPVFVAKHTDSGNARVNVFAQNAAATYLVHESLGSTAPVTWAAASRLEVTIEFGL